MNGILSDILRTIKGDTASSDIVPRSGLSAWLIVFMAGAMTFLAVVALAFSYTAGRVADGWASELSDSLTLRISAPDAQMEEQTKAALAVLGTTPGIASARIVETEEQSALLEPWVGAGLDLSDFALPRVIAVEEVDGGPDREGLLLRLKAEAPGAEMDDHGRWRAPLIGAANKVRNLGGLAIALVMAGLVAVVVLAAQAAVISNAQNISTLRLIGARDYFIARAFVRQITLRALLGALVGTCLGAVLVMAIRGDAGAVTSLSMRGGEWFAAIALIPFVGIVTFVAVRITAFATLKRLS